MASVLLRYVVGDLTVGKPEHVEVSDTETLESCIRTIGESKESGTPVWKQKQNTAMAETSETRQKRFVGILNALDIVSFLAKSEFADNPEKGLKTQISQIVLHENSLLREIDPRTRLLDAIEMMRHGVHHLLVPKTRAWKGSCRRFSILYHGRCSKNSADSSGCNHSLRSVSSSPSLNGRKFCCLSREDVIRFLIGCLGALAPVPLSSVSFLGAINGDCTTIDSSSPAIEATLLPRRDPCAVVEAVGDGAYRILGEISSSKLWKSDYLAASRALSSLSAGQFVTGVENRKPPSPSIADFADPGTGKCNPSSPAPVKQLGWCRNDASNAAGRSSMYRGRSTPLTCAVSSSLAAVMAQMLSHRATHVWVTEYASDNLLVGIVGYDDILSAVVTRPRA